jgi:hypothetical protein
MYAFGFREYATGRVEDLLPFQQILSWLMLLVADLVASI